MNYYYSFLDRIFLYLSLSKKLNKNKILITQQNKFLHPCELFNTFASNT